MTYVPMTKIDGVADEAQAKRGRAFFSGTGPSGTRCGTCVHRGYYRPVERWDERSEQYVERRMKVSGCAMYHNLTGRHGPVVEKEWPSCKYYSGGA